METTIEGAIKLLAGKIAGEVKPGDAMQLAQAALNLAHVLAIQANIKKQQ